MASRILILGQQNPVARGVIRRLPRTDFSVVTGPLTRLRSASAYRPVLSGVNVIASFLGPMDVDLDFEALFDAIHQVRPPLKQFLLLSSAEISSDFHGRITNPKIKNFREYVNEQRYAIKVVDEEEVPYTVLRPVKIIRSSASQTPKVIEEGHPVPNGRVSRRNVVRIALDVIIKREYQNQSIVILDQ